MNNPTTETQEKYEKELEYLNFFKEEVDEYNTIDNEDTKTAIKEYISSSSFTQLSKTLDIEKAYLMDLTPKELINTLNDKIEKLEFTLDKLQEQEEELNCKKFQPRINVPTNNKKIKFLSNVGTKESEK